MAENADVNPNLNKAFLMAMSLGPGQDGPVMAGASDDSDGSSEDGGQQAAGQPVILVAADGEESLANQIEQPAKVMRIGTMIKQLLEEVRAAPLDESGRKRLAEIHASSVRELEEGLSDDLKGELDRLTLPFDADSVPTEAELRIAQAQLVGWLEGLFHGIQTALFAQQMAARAQLEQMRARALPGHIMSADGTPVAPGPERGTGQYL